MTTFENHLEPSFSQPEEHGFMHFTTPNNYPPGSCFTYYKDQSGDVKNEMILLSQNTDDLINMTHYKFQQTHLGIPVEGMGCIEHYDEQGSLIFSNAKHGVNINSNGIAGISAETALQTLLTELGALNYNWLSEDWEQDLKTDLEDDNATYYPTPELIFALDSYTNLDFNVGGRRFQLCYKIKISTTDNVGAKYYFVNAIDGSIFKELDYICNDGIAGVVGYGSASIDTDWRGFPWSNWRLYAQDGGHNIHTKEYGNTSTWSLIQNVEDDAWQDSHLTETTVHHFATRAWDYYRTYYGRQGMDNDGKEVRVKSNWSNNNATFEDENNKGLLTFGTTSTGDRYSWEPSVVGHEFNHGVDEYSADLQYQGESGALDESFADINGIVIQCLMLDNGATDWIIGNSITGGVQRSIFEPKTLGEHYYENGVLSSTALIGQPDTYLGEYFQDPTLPIDNGGVHVNSGVQNHWFYILSQGEVEVNDNSDYYNIDGIGIYRAARIAFLAQTEIMQGSSQFMDSRLATIQAAIYLYGSCSIEHQTVVKAWYAVGVGTQNVDCPSLLDIEENSALFAKVYPNPAKNSIQIETANNDILSVSAIDAFGREVLNVSNMMSTSKLNIDIENLSTGVYTLMINTNNGNIYKQIIKD